MQVEYQNYASWRMTVMMLSFISLAAGRDCSRFDMSFDRKLNEFVIVANRFCWELEPSVDVKSSDGKPIYERRLCGIRIAVSGL